MKQKTEIQETAGTMKACAKSGGFSNSADHAAAGYMIPVGIDGSELGFALRANASHSGDKGDGGVNTNMVVHSLRGEGFDASEDGTGRGTPIVAGAWPKKVADCLTASFAEKQGLEDQHVNSGCGLFVSDKPIFATSGQANAAFSEDAALALNRTNEAPYVAAPSMAVRRLTPRECERLQGFPPCVDSAQFLICFDHQKNCADVEIKCHRSLSNAYSAGGESSEGLASCAGLNFLSDQESQGLHVRLYVPTDFARLEVEIRNHGKSIWSANGAEELKKSLPHTPIESFARVIAVVAQGVGRLTHDGKVESQKNATHFIVPVSGKWPAEMFGQGSEDTARDAASIPTEGIKSIISKHGLNIPNADLTAETWLCSVLNVIALCIPKETPPENFACFEISVESDFTAIQVRGKPAADGPRYKALGNSMAVPVIEWILSRMDLVDETLSK